MRIYRCAPYGTLKNTSITRKTSDIYNKLENLKSISTRTIYLQDFLGGLLLVQMVT